MIGTVAPTRAEAFWARVTVGGLLDCWEWQGAVNENGYGVTSLDGRAVKAHRFAWMLAGRPMPDGMELDHLCRNRRCVNPAHLEPVSGRENTLRGEGITAVNAQKTHCIRGHELTGDNLATRRGWRTCRACEAARMRRTRAALRTAIEARR